MTPIATDTVLGVEAGFTPVEAARNGFLIETIGGGRWQDGAQAAKRAKTAARQASSLRRDFLDAEEWVALARRFKVRLPPWGEPWSRPILSKILKALGRTPDWYKDWAAVKTLNDPPGHNADWPASAWVGLLLEEHRRQLDQAGLLVHKGAAE